MNTFCTKRPRWYLAGLRRGTHKVKEKSEVSGAGQQALEAEGHWPRPRWLDPVAFCGRHGGTVHGPRPRDYSYALPKKILLGALRSALSAKLAEEKLTVVDGWQLDRTRPADLFPRSIS